MVIGAPIHDAVSAKDKKLVIFLLKSNPKVVNLVNEIGQTPIFIAAANNSEDIAKLLLEKGELDKEIINKKDREGYAPIHVATLFTRNPKLIALLIEHGASLVVATEREGFSPLHIVAYEDRYSEGGAPENEIIALFLERACAADFKYKDRQGRTPRGIARELNRRVLAKQFDEYETEAEVRETMLIYNLIDSIQKGEKKLVEGFIKVDPRLINTQDPYGFSPLMAAAQTGNLDLLKWLLGKGANPKLEDIFGRTALYYAKWQPDKRIAEELTKKGALPTAADQSKVPSLPSGYQEMEGRKQLDKMLKMLDVFKKYGHHFVLATPQERVRGFKSKAQEELFQLIATLKLIANELQTINTWLVNFGGTVPMPKEVVEKIERLKAMCQELENLERSIEGLSFYKWLAQELDTLRTRTLEANEDPEMKNWGERWRHYPERHAGGMYFLSTKLIIDGMANVKLAYEMVTRSYTLTQLISEMLQVTASVQQEFNKIFPAESAA